MALGVEADAAPDAATHLVLIDGSGFIFRAFHALPMMTRPDGTPVNAVFGFTNMLAKLLKDHAGTHLAVIFDAGRATFRNRIYDQYKAQRPEPPSELVPQFKLVREATVAFGVPSIELADWEADDLIASYARAVSNAGGRTTIVSSDKDLMQLIRPGVDMLDPIKQKSIGLAEVMEKFGVTPDKLIEVQALMGDSVDNVPGVPGIGPKNAAQLINEYGDLEAVLREAPGMKPSKRREMLITHAEAARMSRQLVILREDAPLPAPISGFATRQPDRAVLAGFLLGMGFRSTMLRLGLEDAEIPAQATSQGAPQGTLSFTSEPTHAPEPALTSAAGYGPYPLVTTLEELEQWIAEATVTGIVAIDTATDRQNAMRSELVGLALATGPGRACYVPLRHTAAEPLVQIAPEVAIAALAPLLRDASVLKLFHDAKYDLLVLLHAGAVAATPTDDTMLLSYAQEAGAHGHSIDELSSLHLGHTSVARDAVTGTGRARLVFSQVPLDRAAAFAGEQADLTWRLWQALRPRLRGNKSLAVYEQMDRRLTPVLLEMERAGVKVDEEELRRMSLDFGTRMAVMETEAHALAGESFNLGSPKALGEMLFDKMSLPGGKRMKTGAWGTDASVLQGLAEQGHDLPAKVMEWRQLAKLKSTYADALVEEINPVTGRVHTSFAMAIASTGRLSSTDPNLQNIPIRTEEGGRIRRAFIAEPGHMLVSCDYSQIELRLLADVANIPTLRASFMAGEDIHARTASEVFGVPMAGMDSATRRRAKAINFGIIYGISAFGLGRQLQIEPGEARGYIEAYFARYPEIRAYMTTTRDEARATGYVLTLFGRRVWIPGIADKNPARRSYAERQASNAPLQGGAADIIKRAMVRLPSALKQANLSARLLLQVHDELLFEAPDHEAEAVALLARDVMSAAASIAVPLVVETGIGRNWAEAH